MDVEKAGEHDTTDMGACVSVAMAASRAAAQMDGDLLQKGFGFGGNGRKEGTDTNLTPGN
jgi:hypothetical protein